MVHVNIFLEKTNNMVLFDSTDFLNSILGDIPGNKRTRTKILLIGMLELSLSFHMLSFKPLNFSSSSIVILRKNI
jgi:hypothetical protein